MVSQFSVKLSTTVSSVFQVGKVCRDGDQFQCENDMCIPIQYVCDTDDDCGDRSDEKLCNGKGLLKGSHFPSEVKRENLHLLAQNRWSLLTP